MMISPAEALLAKLKAAASPSSALPPTSPPPRHLTAAGRRLSTYNGDPTAAAVARQSAAAASGGAALGGAVHMLSRHDLILEDDLPRALEAFLAVDEHRKFRVTLSECDEIFRLMHLKSDRAALLRAKSAAEDSAMVEPLRRTGISCQLALEAGARHLIGTSGGGGGAQNAARQSGTDALRQTSKAASASHSGGAIVIRRSLSARRSSAMFAPSSSQPFFDTSASGATSTTTLSMLSLMRLLFPSYSRRVVEHQVLQLLPPPPTLPPQPSVDHVRILFRSCRSRGGHTDDSDSGTIRFDSLVAACPGASRQELTDLFLLHCSEMQDYLLQDLKAFESLRVFDLLSHAGLPASKLVGVRFTPLLSMVTLCTHWELLRSQLAEHFTLEEQSRLAHVVVFLHQFGAPAVFQVDWPPLLQGRSTGEPDAAAPTASTTTVRFDLQKRMTRGVDGLPRHPIDLNEVGLTLHQLAAMLASPKFPPVAPKPFLCPATVEAIRVLTQTNRGLSSAYPSSWNDLGTTIVNRSSPISELPAVPDSSPRGRSDAVLAANRRPLSAGLHKQQPAAGSGGVPAQESCKPHFDGMSCDADDVELDRNNNVVGLASSSSFSYGPDAPPPHHAAGPSAPDAIFRLLSQCAPPNRKECAEGHGASEDAPRIATEQGNVHKKTPARGFPTQSALRLREASQKAKNAVAVATSMFRVPFLRVVESLGVVAYHRRSAESTAHPSFSSPERSEMQRFGVSETTSHSGGCAATGRTDIAATEQDEADYVVLTPRPGGVSSSAAVRPLSANQRRATPALHNYSGRPFYGGRCGLEARKTPTRPESSCASRVPLPHPPHRMIGGGEDSLSSAVSTGIRRDAALLVIKKQAAVSGSDPSVVTSRGNTST